MHINVNEMQAGVARDIAHETAQRYGLSHTREIDDGFVNHVILAEGGLVIKAPKPDDSEPARLRALASEIMNLDHLETERDMLFPVQTPRLVEYSLAPAYLVATHVPGRASVPREEIKQLSTPKREALGREFGAYMVKQAAIAPFGTSAGERTWVPAFDRYVGNFSHPDYPTLSRKAATLYERWQAHRTAMHTGSTALRFIHGDLRPDNAGLSDTYRIQGVFDFANAGQGDMAEEVSTMLGIDEQVFKGCMAELAQAGLAPDPDQVRLWREMKDLHVLPSWIMKGYTTHPNYHKARRIIMERYPSEDWNEL